MSYPNHFLFDDAGTKTRQKFITVSQGAASSGQVFVANSHGKLDPSFFDAGSISFATYITESASGAVDSVNDTYASSVPFIGETLVVLLNGLEQIKGVSDSYVVLDSTTIQFLHTPIHDPVHGDDKIVLRYFPLT